MSAAGVAAAAVTGAAASRRSPGSSYAAYANNACSVHLQKFYGILQSDKSRNRKRSRQSQHGGLFSSSYNGWQRAELENFKGRGREGSKVVTRAIPAEVSAAATALVVGGALFALTKLNNGAEAVAPAKTECEACGGSGLCPVCNGEGFVNKNLSAEAAAKARAGAKDAATRYTAGLAKKWNYCTTCGGGRGCQSCEGRGWVA